MSHLMNVLAQTGGRCPGCFVLIDVERGHFCEQSLAQDTRSRLVRLERRVQRLERSDPTASNSKIRHPDL